MKCSIGSSNFLAWKPLPQPCIQQTVIVNSFTPQPQVLYLSPNAVVSRKKLELHINLEGNKDLSEPKTVLCVYVCNLKLGLVLT